MNLNKFLIFILILFFVCLAVAPKTADAKAFLYLVPSEKTFGVGEEFLISIRVSSRELPINAISGILYFPKDRLSVVGVSKENSIFSLWPDEPSFSNESGEIVFGGGLPSPGFIGTDGQIISIRFKAKNRGVASLDFGESMILADDGKGTDIFSYAEKSSYTINFPAPVIFSSTHPSWEKWYQNNNPEFRWDLASEITDVSFVFDQDSDTEPDVISEGRLDSQAFRGIVDGIWYFHLRAKDDLGWGLARHFAVNIDTTPPPLFEIAVNNEGDSTNPRPILYFNVDDETSGIDYYKINFESGDSVILANPGINQYQLPIQEPGTESITVQVFDKAGNFRENIAGVVIHPIQEPIITIWPKTYVAGEERLYVEGEALPKTEITIFLEKDNNISKTWKAQVNEKGDWSFSTADILKSGVYYLFTRARDQRGALSNSSPKNEMEVAFSGIAFRDFMITYRKLALVLFVILLTLIILSVYFIRKGLKAKKVLRKETVEAEESLRIGFDELRSNIVNELEKLEGAKSQRELDEKEQEIIRNLKEDLEKIERFIGKEIKDVERELE